MDDAKPVRLQHPFILAYIDETSPQMKTQRCVTFLKGNIEGRPLFSEAKRNIMRGLQPTSLYLAYIGGFLDGDGSLYVRILPREDYALKFQLVFTVSFFQRTSRKHFLMKMKRELGRGILRDRNDGISELTILGWQDVSHTLKLLLPFLRMKHKQAALMMKMIEQLPSTKESPLRFLDLCRLADRVADLNDSKKRKTTSEIVRRKFLDLDWITPEETPL
jgi:hypothetical protein